MAPEGKIKTSLRRLGRALFWPLKLFRDFCAVLGFLTLGLLCIGALYVHHFFTSLPELNRLGFVGVKQLAQKRIEAKIEDKSKRYRWIDINEINRDYLYAIVLAEDAEFFDHDGVVLDSMLNSLADNIRRRKIESGGSTITQQTAKNIFLSNERSFVRKLKELLITRDLEEKLTKNEILEIYLNIAEFGPEIVGANAASHVYFQKAPADVNAAEGAFLALLLPSPRRFHYSLVENKNLTKAHRHKIRRILGDMLHNEYISPKQYNTYLNYDYFDSVKPESVKRHGKPRRGIASKK